MVDTYLMYAASALAANTIIRSAVGAAFPLFTTQMFRGLGIGWACTLIGIIAAVLAPIPFLFYAYGARIRGSSKFAPCVVSFYFLVLYVCGGLIYIFRT
jgi:DHA1 family multidrug resistance protein-like MFS transporter